MAQSRPIQDVAGYTNERCRKDVRSQAANVAIATMYDKLCSGMDSLSVAIRLRQKGLLSMNDLEAVRDFQEVKEAKNSRILQSVESAITVTGLPAFQEFLNVLGEFDLLRPVTTELQELYKEEYQHILEFNKRNREFWAQHCTPPMVMSLQSSSTWQQTPSFAHRPTMPLTQEGQGGYCPRPPCVGSSLSSGPLTPLSRLQPVSANRLYDEHMANETVQQSILLPLMPSHPSHDTHPSYGHIPALSHSSPVPSHSDPQPYQSISVPLRSHLVLPHVIPGRVSLGADQASNSRWSMERPNHSQPVEHSNNPEPMPSQSIPTLMQSDDGSLMSPLTGVTALEQPTCFPSLTPTPNQPALQHVAWQQEIRSQNENGRHPSLDSGLSSLHSNNFTAQHSIAIHSSHMTEESSRPPQQPITPTQMHAILSSGSSSSTGDSGFEEQGGSKKLHWQRSFDKGSVLKQSSHGDSMDSGITGSQASLDNEDEAH